MNDGDRVASRWHRSACAALIATGFVLAGCDRTSPVVNRIENAAGNLADDLGIGGDTDDVRVYFAVGSSTLSAEARSKLDAVARRYAAMEDPGITLIGYSDTSGDAAANLALSQQRAATVQDYLQSRGILSGSFDIEAKGEGNPRVATGNDVRERANRRVRISIDE